MEPTQLDATALVAPAVDGTLRVIHAVKPDQFSARTPCQEWDVRALGAHLRQVVIALDLAGRDGVVPGDLWERELGADDWPARFEEEAGRAVTAWTGPMPAKELVSLGSNPLPAGFATALLVSDLVIHMGRSDSAGPVPGQEATRSYLTTMQLSGSPLP